MEKELNEFEAQDDYEEETEETEEGKESQELGNQEKKAQTKEQNAQFAAMRREKEKKDRQKEIDDAYEKGKKEGQLAIQKINPYTDEKIEDEYDLKMYQLQKEIDEEGGDPINDLPKRLAKIEREKAKKSKEQAEQDAQKQKKIDEDSAQFVAKYPDVNTKELFEDKRFQKFAKRRLGVDSFVEIYEDFKDLFGEEDKIISKEAQKRAMSPSSKGTYTKEKSVDDMSDEEFRKWWNKKYNN